MEDINTAVRVTVESLWVEMDKDKIIIGVCCRPPNSTEEVDSGD